MWFLTFQLWLFSADQKWHNKVKCRGNPIFLYKCHKCHCYSITLAKWLLPMHIHSQLSKKRVTLFTTHHHDKLLYESLYFHCLKALFSEGIISATILLLLQCIQPHHTIYRHSTSTIHIPPHSYSPIYGQCSLSLQFPGIIHGRAVTSKTMPRTSDDILTFPYQYCNAIKQVTKC